MITQHFYPLAFALALAACAPGAAEYSRNEAPNRLQVDGATSELAVAFAPGSARLGTGEAARLDRLVANGAIQRGDRVAVAASGMPALADARAAAISSRLLRWGIVADARPIAAVPANRAIVMVGRYAVTLPPCPNWSMNAGSDFTNAPASNFGCATAVNLGMMVANPADLAQGRTLASADGKPAAAAVDRYLNDRVVLPTEVQLGPIAPSSSDSTPAAPASPTEAQ